MRLLMDHYHSTSPPFALFCISVMINGRSAHYLLHCSLLDIEAWIVPASLLYEVFSFNIIVTGENTFSCRGRNLSESDKMRKTRKRRVEGPKLP